jgi:hypothetical protein
MGTKPILRKIQIQAWLPDAELKYLDNGATVQVLPGVFVRIDKSLLKKAVLNAKRLKARSSKNVVRLPPLTYRV